MKGQGNGSEKALRMIWAPFEPGVTQSFSQVPVASSLNNYEAGVGEPNFVITRNRHPCMCLSSGEGKQSLHGGGGGGGRRISNSEFGVSLS